jgi:hypothetical protein
VGVALESGWLAGTEGGVGALGEAVGLGTPGLLGEGRDTEGVPPVLLLQPTRTRTMPMAHTMPGRLGNAGRSLAHGGRELVRSGQGLAERLSYVIRESLS